MKKYRIVITNDDGIDSPSIRSLIDHLGQEDYKITVVAPKYPQTAKGMSHAHGDVWVDISEEIKNGIKWVTVNNSPTTCTSVALRVLKLQPDLVISGINFGENLGLNMFYSGTVGAAWEAAMSNVPALASSLELPSGKHFSIDETIDFNTAASLTVGIAKKLLIEQPSCKLWSLNIPSNATSTTEVKKCKIASKRWNYPIVREQKEEDGMKRVRFEFDPKEEKDEPESDIYYLRRKYATLSEIATLTFPWT